MKIEIGEDIYEINGENVERIFEDSKKYLLNILNNLETKEKGEEELYLYMLALQTQLHYLIYNQMCKKGGETFLESLGAIKIVDNQRNE